jgi:hypothetical protein
MPRAMVEDLPAGKVRDAMEAAVDEIGVQADEPLHWAQDARCRTISLQGTSGPMSSLSMKAEEVVARVRSLLN